MPGDDRSRVLAGRYHLREPLGEGGMGVVWRAWDGLLHQTVAIKEVALPAGLPAEERDERLRWTLREARTSARLRGHPGIVTIYDVVEEDGRPWIVMELIEGPSLAQVIRTERRLPEKRVAELGMQVLSALAAAEAAGVVHRDVKPGNILLKHGQAVLTDFGIAIALDSTNLTRSGPLVGTPAYLAPEQIEGRRASAASDLWAVGVTLYQAVEGRRPFDRESMMATIAAIVQQPPDPPRYADRLRPVLDGLLHKDPARRLTADQALRLLAPVAGRPPEAASPVAVPGPPAAEPGGPARPGGTPGLGGSAALGGAAGTTAPAAASRRTAVRVSVAVASVLAAVAVTGGVIAWTQDTASRTAQDATPAPAPATPTAVAGSAAATSETSGSAPASAPPTPAVTTEPSDPSGAALPRGFSLYRKPAGFTLAVPDGWTRREQDAQVNWERPKDSPLTPISWHLGAAGDVWRKETRQPAEILDQLRQALAGELFAPGSYRELSRRSVPQADGRAAELEFQFGYKGAPNMLVRLYARCVVRDSGGVGMFWFFAPAGDWAEAGPHLDTFVRTFRLT